MVRFGYSLYKKRQYNHREFMNYFRKERKNGEENCKHPEG